MYKWTIGESQLLSKEELYVNYDSTFTDMIYIYAPTSAVTFKEEFFIYDLMLFTADCGGMGGILLGFSFVTGFERVLKLIQKIKKKPC